MAGTLTYKRGDTWNPVFYIGSTAALSVAGCTARSQIRTKDDTLVVDMSSEGASPELVLSEEDGKIRIDMTVLPVVTETVAPGRYKLDIEMTYADGLVRSYPETEDLTIVVKQDVTYVE